MIVPLLRWYFQAWCLCGPNLAHGSKRWRAKLAESRISVVVVKSDADKANHEAENDAEQAHTAIEHKNAALQKAKDL